MMIHVSHTRFLVPRKYTYLCTDQQFRVGRGKHGDDEWWYLKDGT
jgi:hypothetical protein